MAADAKDEGFMRRALLLAKRGEGKTSPNPPVGCVIVRNDRIIGEGYHKRAGKDHAEIIALKRADAKAKGSTMYVTLEPCSHWGKTPPCVDRIIQSAIKRVVIAARDPNKNVSAIRKLRRTGIKVTTDVCKEEAQKLIEHHAKFSTTKRPFLTIKLALSFDGKVAAKSTNSRYITSRASLKEVHRLRTTHDAVMVGIDTVRADDPRLDPRHVKGDDPLKIVVDSKLRIPSSCALLKNPKKLIIATTKKAPIAKRRKLEAAGVTILACKANDGKVDLGDLLDRLGERQITSVLAEGGPTLAASLLKRRLADKLILFYAPCIIGEGKPAFADSAAKHIKDAKSLTHVFWQRFGDDMMFEGYL